MVIHRSRRERLLDREMRVGTAPTAEVAGIVLNEPHPLIPRIACHHLPWVRWRRVSLVGVNASVDRLAIGHQWVARTPKRRDRDPRKTVVRRPKEVVREVKHIKDVRLIHERQDRNPRAETVPRRAIAAGGRSSPEGQGLETAVRRLIIERGQRKLLQIVDALGAAGRLASRLHRGQ